MRGHLLFATMIFWLSPQTACAQAYLAWDNCPAEGGTLSRLSDCNTNAGSNTLVVSFVWPGPEKKLLGMDLSLDVLAKPCQNYFGPCSINDCANPPLPSYWLSCRSSAISVSNDFTGAPFATSSACNALGTAPVQWVVGSCPELLQIRALCDWAEDARPTMYPWMEYYAFRIVITNDKTVGAAACPGCCARVWMAFSNAHGETGLMLRFDGELPYRFSGTLSYPTWSGSPSACTTPAANTTWGRVKGIYR